MKTTGRLGRLSRFRSRKDDRLPRRIRMKRAKKRRLHPRWVRQLYAVHRASRTVQELLTAFDESASSITDTEALLRHVNPG